MTDEIKPPLNNPYWILCGWNYHCLAVALVVTIIISIALFIIIGLVIRFRRRIFPCCKKPVEAWKESQVDLNDLSNYLVNQPNARVSAKFIGKNAEIHISSKPPENEHLDADF